MNYQKRGKDWLVLFAEGAEGTPAQIKDANADVAVTTVGDTTVTSGALAAADASSTNATPDFHDAAATPTMVAGG